MMPLGDWLEICSFHFSMIHTLLAILLAPYADGNKDVNCTNECSAEVQSDQAKDEFFEVDLDDLTVGGLKSYDRSLQCGLDGCYSFGRCDWKLFDGYRGRYRRVLIGIMVDWYGGGRVKA